MPGPTILNSSIPEEVALRDTQVDEYYTESDPDTCEQAYESIAENPYPGIRPFRTTEYLVFFGRDGISSDLIKNLSLHRFLPVLGSSGTGKSSLIRAGLLPVLETIPGKNGSWKVIICRPGKNPFGNLARAISASGIAPGYSEFDIWKILSSSSYGYQQLYNDIDTSAFYNTLIIIDQFEELFRYRNDYGISGRNDAAMFVKMLIDTSKNEALKCYVLITMRSEYLGECVQLPQLVDAINNSQYLVPRLKSKQLVDVIEQPADYCGAILEDGYATKMVGEIGDNMDQLPVLQHVLRRAYEHAKERAASKDNVTIAYNDYLEVGGMENALDQHATEVYNTLTPSQQEYCRILFQSITDKTTDGRGVRRPLSFLTIYNICRQKKIKGTDDHSVRRDLEHVIDSFRKDDVNFLMPPPHVALTDDLEIDISHESLMRTWKKMQPWIEEEARDASLLNELMQRDKAELIEGNKLLMFAEWKKRKSPDITWARLYKNADTSTEIYDQKFENAIALISLNKNRERNSKLRWAGILAFVLLSIIISALLYHQKNDQQKENLVLRSFQDSLTLKQNQLEKNRDELAVNQIELNKIIDTLHIKEGQLQKTYDTILRQKNKLASEIREKEEVNYALEVSRWESDKNANQLQKSNNELLQKSKELSLKADSLRSATDSASKLKNFALAIKHSQKSLAIPTFDSTRENIKSHLALLSYQLFKESGEEENRKNQPQVYAALYAALRNKALKDKSYQDVWQVTPYHSNIDRLAYAAVGNSKNNHLTSYLTAEDKKLYAFDFMNKDASMVAKVAIGNKLVSVAASDNGKWLAVNTLSKKLLLIDENNHQDTISLTGVVRTAKFSLDNTVLYIYTQDSTLTSINLLEKTRLSAKIKFNLQEISISNKFIYGLTIKGEIFKWPRGSSLALNPETFVNTGRLLYRASSINCTPDDALVVWGNEHGQVFYKMNGANSPQYLTRFSGRVTDIAFDDSSKMVAVSSYDRTIQVFNIPHAPSMLNLQSEVPLVLTNNEGPVTSLFFRKGNNGEVSLIAVISPGLIREYPMNLQSMACRLNGFYKNKRPSPNDLDLYIDKAVPDRNIEIKCP